jgi:hypothetical protein
MRANFVISICCAVLGVISLSASTFAQQKTAKACTEEWRANKAANQAAGITEKDYVAKCKGGAATAPSKAPTPNTKSATAKQVPTCQPSLSNLYHCPDTSPAASALPTGAGQFATEAQARGQCPSDTVVWANTKSKIYHFSGTRSYGHTKQGAYMCEKDSISDGMRAAKNEAHP